MKRYEPLDRLLDYLEENIDLDHVATIEQLQYDAINYHAVPHLPLTIRTTPDGFEQIPMSEAYDNPELMMYNELLWSTMHSTYNSVRIKDDGPLMIRSNHGIGILASLFGCKSSIFDDQMPWVEHISLDQAKKNFADGVPDFNQALGAKVCDTYRYYHQRLAAYPKCYKAIRMQQPDLQGPFDILHLVVGNEAFYLPYDEPEFCHEMLEIISQTYIGYRKFVDPLLNDRIHDAVFVHGFCVGGKVLIKADTASANLSEDMYQEYEANYDQKIIEAFEAEGGGSYHTCGVVRMKCAEATYNPYLRCVNYGNPETNDFQATYDFWSKNKVGIIGWGYNQNYDYCTKTIGPEVQTGVTLMTKAASVQEGIEIMKRHRG